MIFTQGTPTIAHRGVGDSEACVVGVSYYVEVYDESGSHMLRSYGPFNSQCDANKGLIDVLAFHVNHAAGEYAMIARSGATVS